MCRFPLGLVLIIPGHPGYGAEALDSGEENGSGLEKHVPKQLHVPKMAGARGWETLLELAIL
jgi:hypothetical protein